MPGGAIPVCSDSRTIARESSARYGLFTQKPVVADLSEPNRSAVAVLPDLIVYPNRIRKLREALGLPINAIVEQTGRSLSYLSYVERGLRRPSPANAALIAAALGVSPDRLEVLPSDDDEYAEWLAMRDLSRAETQVSLLFGQRLRALRKQRGISIRQLREKSPLLETWQLRQIESYGRTPSSSELSLLAEAFGFPSTIEFQAEIEAIPVEISVDPTDTDTRKAINLGVLALIGGKSPEAKEPDAPVRDKNVRGSKSIDGDLLAAENWLLKGAVIRVIRESFLMEGALYVIMTGKVPVGVGRAVQGSVVSQTGQPFIGQPWRIISILYSERLF